MAEDSSIPNANESVYVKSPCIKNCCLDEKDICIGCYRTLDEILKWSSSSSMEKKEIIRLAHHRKVNH